MHAYNNHVSCSNLGSFIICWTGFIVCTVKNEAIVMHRYSMAEGLHIGTQGSMSCKRLHYTISLWKPFLCITWKWTLFLASQAGHLLQAYYMGGLYIHMHTLTTYTNRCRLGSLISHSVMLKCSLSRMCENPANLEAKSYTSTNNSMQTMTNKLHLQFTLSITTLRWKHFVLVVSLGMSDFAVDIVYIVQY